MGETEHPAPRLGMLYRNSLISCHSTKFVLDGVAAQSLVHKHAPPGFENQPILLLEGSFRTTAVGRQRGSRQALGYTWSARQSRTSGSCACSVYGLREYCLDRILKWKSCCYQPTVVTQWIRLSFRCYTARSGNRCAEGVSNGRTPSGT
jgi:hypothetical protein